jgi:hypothetical protein
LACQRLQAWQLQQALAGGGVSRRAFGGMAERGEHLGRGRADRQYFVGLPARGIEQGLRPPHGIGAGKNPQVGLALIGQLRRRCGGIGGGLDGQQR